MKSILVGAIALIAAPFSTAADLAGSDTIRTTTLENGLQIIVWPDHDIPNVAMYNWVRAGGRNEVPGITGLSHFFEHMMFNGTSRRAPGEFDRIMEANGGSNNAYTSNDVTVYQDWFPSSALETIFDLEADRFANLAFNPDVVESERGVVYSERRSAVDNNNDGALYEQMQATAFVAHPYQFPVIGWPSDIESWTMEDLRAYFTTYYAPNNCTMIFVGDVDPDRVFELARTYFGPIPAQEPPPAVRTVEPEQRGERRLVIEKPLQTPVVQIAWKSPQADDPSGPALDLLLSILADGDSSRLHRRLVDEEQIAIAVSSYRHQGFDPGLTWLFLTLPQGADPLRAEAILYEELEKVISDGVTDAELAKAKSNVVAGFWRAMATINGKASALGRYQVFHGDYRKLFAVPDQYDAVDKAALQAIAKTIFDPLRRTVGMMVPPAAEDAS